MVTRQAEAYVPGRSIVAPNGEPKPQERKSPPLNEVTPERDRYLTIRPERHFSPEYGEREWNRLWAKTWICAGRESDLASVGSWFRFDLGRESFVVVRSAQQISALYNVCQHRGNRLVDDDFGKSASFVCSYHSWRYDLCGKNVRVTDAAHFKPGALCGRLDMRAVRCETWGGFVFINMDDEAPALSTYLGEIAGIAAAYRMEKMHVVRDIVVEMDCNWKVILDAFSENYHVHMTHPAAMTVTEDVWVQMDFYKGGHSRRITPLGSPSSRLAERSTLDPLQQMLLTEAGVDPALFKGKPSEVRRAIQLAKRAPDNRLGLDYSGFSDNQLSDDWAINVFPNMHWSSHPEGVLCMRYYPHASDPNRCCLHILILAAPLAPGARLPAYMGVPPDADLSGATRPARIRARADDPDIKDVIGQLLYEDIRNTRESQRGLQSRGFEAIRLSELEQCMQHQYAEMDRYMGTSSATATIAGAAGLEKQR